MADRAAADTAQAERAVQPEVHYLTPQLTVPCTPARDLNGAPLNTTFPAAVTCEACKDSPEYLAGLRA